VDAQSQVIVAMAITQAAPDQRHLVSMVEEIERELGELPPKLLADAGYFSAEGIGSSERHGVDVYCPPDSWRMTERTRCPRGRPPSSESFVQRMRRKVLSHRGRWEYRWRKVSVEPTIGQMKQGRGLRQFLLRGKTAVSAEWKLWG
jgi:hypothetical protein